MTDKLTAEELERIGLIAIVRTDRPAGIRHVADALIEGGVKAVEITLTTPGALDMISTLRAAFADTLHVGAGTILSPDDARSVIDAGAEFVATPTLQPDSVSVCREAAIPVACGTYTPTECLAAHRAGADFVKLFPAEGLGPSYVRSILGPLPFLKIMPTGGVTPQSIPGFIRAGCVAVAAGSSLISSGVLENQNWTLLTQLAASYTQALADARSGKKT